MLDLCMFAEGSRHEQQLVVTGDIGRIEATVPGDALYISNRAENAHRTVEITPDPRVRWPGVHHGASYIEHLQFQQAIAENRPADVTPEEGLLSVAMGIAAQQSIATGDAVLLKDLIKVEL